MSNKASPKAATPKAATSNAVVQSVAGNTLPKNVDEFLTASQGMQTGLENVTLRDIIVPRLTILQGLSPQVTKGKPEFDPVARVGMIWDVALSEGWNEVAIIPLHYLVQYIVWAPRKANRKGPVAILDHLPPESTYTRDEKGKLITKDGGNTIVETAQIYCLNMAAEGRPSFIPMSSTQLKKARKLMTYATNASIEDRDGNRQTPPLYYYSYKLETVPESNAEGDWMGWKVSPLHPIIEYDNWQIRLAAIRGFRESIIKGEMRGEIIEDDDGTVAATPNDQRRM